MNNAAIAAIAGYVAACLQAMADTLALLPAHYG
jgi:hypothetical protein